MGILFSLRASGNTNSSWSRSLWRHKWPQNGRMLFRVSFLFLIPAPSPQVVAGDTLHCGCSHAAHPYHGGHACFLYSLGFLFEAPLVSYVLQKLFSEWRGDQALALGVLFLSHTAVASMQSHVVSVQFHEGKKFYTQVKYICKLVIRGVKVVIVCKMTARNVWNF